MELEQILKLIDAVSKSALTGFSLEEGETKLTLTAERVKEFNPVQQTGEPGIQSGCMQASQAGNRSGVSEERTQSMTTGNPAAMDGYSFTAAGGEYQADTPKKEKQGGGTGVGFMALLRRWSAFSTVRRPRKTNHLLQWAIP